MLFEFLFFFIFLFDFKVEGNSISHGLNWCASVFG